MVTTDELLDMAVPRRIDAFRFDLLDSSLSTIGTVDVRSDRVPTVECNVNRTVKRTMSGFHLDPLSALAIDTLTAASDRR